MGFAIRSGKAKLGVGAIEFTKGRIPLMLLCDSAGENTKKEARSLSKRRGSKLLLVRNCTVEQLTNKPNCKLAAVLDENLANAILSVNDDDFVILEA